MLYPARSPDRAAVTALLAQLGDRAPGAVGEQIGSLELTWLITKVEQAYQITLDFDDDVLARMTTIDSAVTELHKALAAAGHG